MCHNIYHSQVRLKEISQIDLIPVFPLAGVWISRFTSVITCIALSTLVRWLGAHQCSVKSVENCISVPQILTYSQ